jgi:tripartite-type tricarboxylate transporter receptor subunit TctC
VLVTQPSLNARSLAEFIRLVKAKPGMSYGSSGNGAITHLAIERMKQETGMDLQHVPFKGTVGAVASVLGGDTVLAFGTIPGTVPHAKAGKLVLLGSSFAKRFSQIPDVPPVSDTLPGFDMGFYTALFAPPGTPRELVQRIYAVTGKAFTNPKLKEIYAASAAEPGTMSPAELKAYMAAEVKSWGEVVRKVGLKID